MGYAVQAAWRKDRQATIPGRPDLTVKHYSGYYLSREPDSP
jgi:hypothetical protein